MANKKHMALLKRGVGAWNTWRRTNPRVRPNLSGARLFGATLCGADLRGADLRGTGLSEADLIDAPGWFAAMNRPEVVGRQRTDASGVAR